MDDVGVEWPCYGEKLIQTPHMDRCGETVDRIRSVRTGQFKYIRNYHPLRPLLQPNQ